MTNSKALTCRFNALTGSQLDYWVIDGSGSMQGKWWDFMASADAFMNILRSANVNSHVMVSVFDDQSIGYIQRDEPIAETKSFIESPLGAGFGGTPLYDAINVAGQELNKLNPEKCSVVFVTDGDESDSTFTDLAQAKSILAWMKAKGWQVTFLGCDFNTTDLANRLGLDEAQTIGVAKPKLLAAAKNLADKRVRHANGGGDMHFTGDEKQQFGGYLTKG